MSEVEQVIPRNLDNKLFDARDIEGNIRSEDINNIRELNELISERPSIVGIGVYGSTVGGYSNEDSDLDLRLLWDSSEEGYSYKTVKANKEFVENAIANIDGFKNKKVTFIENDLNPEYMKASLESQNLGHIDSSVYQSIAQVCRLVPGKKIDKYRQIYAEEIGKQPKWLQEEVISKVVNYFVEEDANRNYKIRKRTGKTEEEIRKLMETRKNMWEKRARKIYRVPKPD